MSDTLTVAQAAAALGTSPQTVRALLRKGELPGEMRAHGSRHVWEVSQEGLDAFLAEFGRLDGHRRQPRIVLPRVVEPPAEPVAAQPTVAQPQAVQPQLVPPGLAELPEAPEAAAPIDSLLVPTRSPEVATTPPVPAPAAPAYPSAPSPGRSVRDGPTTDPERPDRRPFVLRPRGRACVVVIVLGIPLLVAYASARVLPAAWWFDEIGQSDLFTRVIAMKVQFYALVAAPVTFFVWMNLGLALSRTFVVRRTGGALALAATSLVTGTLFASAASSHWQTFLLWRHRQPFGVVDPVHGKDVGFFVFTLPFDHLLCELLLWLVAVTAGYVMAVDAAKGTLTLRPVRATFATQVHLAALAAAFLLVVAWRFRLEQYSLELGQPSAHLGGAFPGAGYVDVHVRLPGYGALLVLAVVLAIGCLAAPFLARTGRVRLPRRLLGLAAAVLLVATVLVAALVPALVQRFAVDPNPLLSEGPYLDRSIRATRTGLGLDAIAVEPYAPTGTFRAADFPAVKERVRNVVVWDTSLLGARMRQLVSDTPYYRPETPTLDVTRVEGRRQPTVVAARELDVDAVDGGASTWVNDRLAYTHGMGLARFSATEVAPSRGPRVLDTGLGVRQPRIYFGNFPQAGGDGGGQPTTLTPTTRQGLAGSPWVLVDSRRPEVDIAASDSAPPAAYHYTGSGGIELSSWTRRAVLAATLGSKDLLLSDDITPQTRLLLHRDVHDRLHALAPFIQWDSHAVPLTADGRVVFVVDGYTTSSDYPYAEAVDLDGTSVNYVRASVRATVDAFSGDVDVYLTDPTEPIARAWAEAFPALFRPADELPSELRARLRYPQDLFAAQATAYERYHTTRPEPFTSDSDAWARPLGLAGSLEVAGDVDFDDSDVDDLRLTIPPTYSFSPPPGHTTPRLVLGTTYTPRNAQNVVGTLSGWIDRRGRPRLAGLNLGRDPVTLGPAQISRLVFATSRVRNLLGLRNLEIRDLDKSSLDAVILGQPHLLFLPAGPVQIQSLYEGSRGPGAARLLGVTAYLNGRAGLGPTIDSAVRQALNAPPHVDVRAPVAPAVVGRPVALTFDVENARREVVTISSPSGAHVAQARVTTGRGAVSWVPTAAGTVRVRVVVAGLDGTRATGSTTFRVLDVPPSIRLTRTPSRAVVGRPVRVSFTVKDSVRAWAKVSTRSGVVFTRHYLIRDGAGSVTWTPKEPGPAALLLRTVGHQGQGASTTLRLTVAPRPATPIAPTIDLLRAPDTATVGEPTRIAFRADQCRTAVARIVGPAQDTRVWRFPCPAHRATFTWTPARPGRYVLTVEAHGDEGQTASAAARTEVAPAPGTSAEPSPTVDLLRAAPVVTVGKPSEFAFAAADCRVAVARIERAGEATPVWRFPCPEPNATFTWTPAAPGRYLLTTAARGVGGRAHTSAWLNATTP